MGRASIGLELVGRNDVRLRSRGHPDGATDIDRKASCSGAKELGLGAESVQALLGDCYREHDILGRSLTSEEARQVTNIARRIAAILLLAPALDANYESVNPVAHLKANRSCISVG